MDVRDDVVEILAGFLLFADLSTPELDRLVELFDEAWFADGERILRQGFSGSGFYVILDGSAVIRIDGVDRSTLRAGDYFGEISCLLGVPPTADIVAGRFEGGVDAPAQVAKHRPSVTLERRDHRMARRVEMRKRVRMRRIFAASGVTASEADTNLRPFRTHPDAILATVGAGLDPSYFAEVLAGIGHDRAAPASRAFFAASRASRRARLSFGHSSAAL